MITLTDSAKKKILELRTADGRPGLGVRLAISGRAFGSFRYDLRFAGHEEKTAEDTVVNAGEFDLYVDPASAPHLRGSTMDYVEGAEESGFNIQNPNPLWTDPTALAVQQVIDGELNPAIAGHGGWVALVDVRGDTAYVALGGGCQGCSGARMTLQQGVETAIRRAVPQITQVVDTTDHAGGTHPYRGPSE